MSDEHDALWESFFPPNVKPVKVPSQADLEDTHIDEKPKPNLQLDNTVKDEIKPQPRPETKPETLPRLETKPETPPRPKTKPETLPKPETKPEPSV